MRSSWQIWQEGDNASRALQVSWQWSSPISQQRSHTLHCTSASHSPWSWKLRASFFRLFHSISCHLDTKLSLFVRMCHAVVFWVVFKPPFYPQRSKNLKSAVEKSKAWSVIFQGNMEHDSQTMFHKCLPNGSFVFLSRPWRIPSTVAWWHWTSLRSAWTPGAC